MTHQDLARETGPSRSAPQTGPPRGPTRIWIDTDPSIGLPLHDADDAFALALAVASPEVEIVGISVSYGNTSQRRAMRIATAWVRAAGVEPGLLVEGATAPGRVDAASAASRLEQGGPIVYVALAPLTHLAGILRHRPDLASRIQRVVFVGGRSPGVRLKMGNRLPYEFHDANFEKDPASAEELLRAECGIDLFPVERGPSCMLLQPDFEKMADSGPVARWLAARGRNWLRGWRWGFGMKGAPCFDLPAVGALIHPDKFQWEERFLSIQPGYPPQFIASEQGDGCRIRFCTRIDPSFAPQAVQRISTFQGICKPSAAPS